jgi:hypothetical protein
MWLDTGSKGAGRGSDTFFRGVLTAGSVVFADFDGMRLVAAFKA